MSPPRMLLPTRCMQSSFSLSFSYCVSLPLSLSLSLSLCKWGTGSWGTLWRGRKGAEQRLMEFATLPYHPDHPECQLPSRALQGAACHSGWGWCASGAEEPGAKSLPLEESKALWCSSLADSWKTNHNTPVEHVLKHTHTLPHMGTASHGHCLTWAGNVKWWRSIWLWVWFQ